MSDHYFMKTLAHLDEKFCFLKSEPEGTNDNTYRMARGVEMGALYPKDARVMMAKDYKGTKVPSLVGNTCMFLIVDDAMKSVIEKANVGKIEYLPLSILDHKKKLASDKHWVVNPIGAFDCLDLTKSKIKRFKDKVLGVQKFALDAKKLEKAPDLFRIPEWPTEYVFSKALLAEIKKLKPTNVFVTKVEEREEFS